MLVKIVVISGPGRGGVAVWHGGATLRGHQGGFFGFVKMTLDIHDARAESLRGDTIASAYFGYHLTHFETTKGALSEAPGPEIDGDTTDAVTLDIADPGADHDVSREVMYLSRTTHMPLEIDRFEGALLVKTDIFSRFEPNIGLTDADFEV
jgi:hypothetical protein